MLVSNNSGEITAVSIRAENAKSTETVRDATQMDISGDKLVVLSQKKTNESGSGICLSDRNVCLDSR